MQRDRRKPGAQQAALSFDDARDLRTANGDVPAHEDTSHVSHVTRRRMVSEPAEEVSLDEVVLIDERAAANDDQPEAWAEPSSVAPIAMDVEEPSHSAPINVPITKGPTERPRRSRAPMVISVLALAVGVAAGAFVQRGVHADAGRAASARTAPMAAAAAVTPNETVVLKNETPVTPATTALPSAASASAGGIPQVDVAALPKAKVGTVIGLADHRLWIDGKLAESWKALVDCGSHVVQVGSAGTPRTVQVPCGDEIKATP